MDLAEHQPAHDRHAHAGGLSAEDDSPALSAYSGSEAPRLQHPGDADDVGPFHIVQVSHARLGVDDAEMSQCADVVRHSLLGP